MLQNIFRFLLALALLGGSASANPLGVNVGGGGLLFTTPEVHITIRAQLSPSSGVGSLLDRSIELNWANLPSNVTWVGLFSSDPTLNSSTPLYRTEVDSSSGYADTRVRYEPVNVSVANRSSSTSTPCTGYWIAAYNTNSSPSPYITNCLKIYPRWMQELKNIIGPRRLTNLIIPGTHNAGAWKYYARGDELNAVTQYTYNQEDPIYTQLQYGIRYLDIRVGYSETYPEPFGIYHGIRLRPLSTLLVDVKRFIIETGEIVIMDFHRFEEGLDSRAVQELLINFVVGELGDQLLVRKSRAGSVDPSLDMIWGSGGHVLWTYPDSGMVAGYDFLWPSVVHAWADTNTPSGLQSYLNTAHRTQACRGRLWSAMAELTPTVEDIVTKPLFGLRKFAQLVNPPVTEWYRDVEWYGRANIISPDFFLGNNIVEMAVRVNGEGGACRG